MVDNFIGSRLSQLRKRAGLTANRLARSMRVDPSTVSKVESGENKPSIAFLERACEVLGISMRFFFAPGAMIPVLGRIPAGVPMYAEENWEGEVDLAQVRADFALRVTGQSMIFAGIHDGDYALLRDCATPQPGQIVAAVDDGDDERATLKYFIQEQGRYLLRSANPQFPDSPFTDQHRVVGVLCGILRDGEPGILQARSLLSNAALLSEQWSEVALAAAQAGLDAEDLLQMLALMGKIKKG